MTMFRADLLKGKRILVTGGGTGLGREMADEYAKLGAEVYICGRRGPVVKETARELAKAHSMRVTGIECDIRAPDSVEDMMTRVFNEGPLTGLVNNAAGNFISRTKDLSPNGFNTIANIVFHGTFYVTLAAGKRWIEAKQKGT
jgi:NAD(P)-dependent dehydrogenase (short-subunit alcohol dehydrogenase family)